MMDNLKIELIADEEQGGFTARIPDLPAYGEGATEEAAIADLKEAVAGYIDAFGLEDALDRIISPTVREVKWDLAGMSHG
jgi:predicted RNase H-like HicB family nuclease